VGLSWRASGHALVPGLSYSEEWSFRQPASMQAKENERLGKWVQGRFEKARPRHFWCIRSVGVQSREGNRDWIGGEGRYV
jgi:hypothetical protein